MNAVPQGRRFFGVTIAALSLAAQTRLAGGWPAGVDPHVQGERSSLGTDSENGSFNGMSHSGTLLVLRNLFSGVVPCGGAA